MKVSRTIQGRAGRWTITDANLSPDNERSVHTLGLIILDHRYIPQDDIFLNCKFRHCIGNV